MALQQRMKRVKSNTSPLKKEWISNWTSSSCGRSPSSLKESEADRHIISSSFRCLSTSSIVNCSSSEECRSYLQSVGPLKQNARLIAWLKWLKSWASMCSQVTRFRPEILHNYSVSKGAMRAAQSRQCYSCLSRLTRRIGHLIGLGPRSTQTICWTCRGIWTICACHKCQIFTSAKFGTTRRSLLISSRAVQSLQRRNIKVR